jgi:hypothetical protein
MRATAHNGITLQSSSTGTRRLWGGDYFMMIVGVYATFGVFVINAARSPGLISCPSTESAPARPHFP